MQADHVSTWVILGAGGHGRVVADAAALQMPARRLVATDRNPARCAGQLLSGVPLQAIDQALAQAGGRARVHIAIGDNAARRREAEAIGAQRLGTVVHPRACVSTHALVGAGCFIAAQAVVAPGVQLGRGVVVNHAAVVDHDVRVGDYCHIAPGAVLGGGVTLGDGVLVGSGATVRMGLTVCDDALIGAGAVVCQDLTEPGVYAGVPARKIR